MEALGAFSQELDKKLPKEVYFLFFFSSFLFTLTLHAVI